MRYLLIFVAIASIFVGVKDWELETEMVDSVYDPQQVWLAGKNKVLVNDLAQKTSQIHLIDETEDSISEMLRTGRGPAETSTTFYKRVTKFSNGDFLFWDAGLNRTSIYDSTLNYKVDIGGSGLRTKFYQTALINDSTLATFDFNEPFLKVWRIRNNRVNTNNLLWGINLDDYEELSPLKNIMLLQSLYFDNYDGILYIGFEFASILMAIDEEGVKFITDKPDEIPLPINTDKEFAASLPVMGKHPEGARDVAVDENYVYLLFSGETISRFEQMKYTFNFETLIDKVKHSKRLLLYDRFTGNFIREVKLPIYVKGFKIRGNEAYLLNSIDKEPRILKYKVESL